MEDSIDFRLKCWYENGCNMYQPGCTKICHRYLEMNHLISTCGMKHADKYLKPIVPQQVEFQSYKRLNEIKEASKSFVENGKNLFIKSANIQTAKTTWSLKIMYKFFDEIWSGNGFRARGYFIHVPEFLSNMRNFEYKNTPQYKKIDKLLKTVDIVVWDDITAQKLLPSEQDILNLYISKRITEDKSNIFNGNLSQGHNLEDILGVRLATRIQTNCEIVELLGTSRVK